MPSSEMLEIIGPALVAGIMISLTHAPLGVEVLKRGIIFIDLAVAQIAGLGLVVADMFLHEKSEWYLSLMALLFAISAGLFFNFVEKVIPKQLEAIIGCSFVLSASLALLMLADRPHGGEEIQHLLSGQILFVSWDIILKHVPVYFIILIIWFFKPSFRRGVAFYILFAVAITSSVQLVGVYVVFASLIMPAIATAKAKNKNLMAIICGILSLILGIILSILLDKPSGPMIVVTYTAIMILTMFFINCFFNKKATI